MESVAPVHRPQPLKAFLCFDIEATCIMSKTLEFPHEIIEFPVVLVKWTHPETESTLTNGKIGVTESSIDVLSTPPDAPTPAVKQDTPLPTLEVVDTFHTYVRPTWRPTLDTFCTGLTGIKQDTVDNAPYFPEVLKKFEVWLKGHDLLTEEGSLAEGVVWVTDGPTDLKNFIPAQLHITPLRPAGFSEAYPKYLVGPYVDLKEGVKNYLQEKWHRKKEKNYKKTRLTIQPGPTRNVKKVPSFYRTLQGQLVELGLGQFKGRQHSGIDDAMTMVRILTELAAKDVLLETNDCVPTNARRFQWMGEQPGEIIWDRP